MKLFQPQLLLILAAFATLASSAAIERREVAAIPYPGHQNTGHHQGRREVGKAPSTGGISDDGTHHASLPTKDLVANKDFFTKNAFLAKKVVLLSKTDSFLKSLSTKNFKHPQWNSWTRRAEEQTKEAEKQPKNADDIYVLDVDWAGWNADGDARNTLIFDDLFNLTESWGGTVPFYLDQFVQPKDRIPNNFYLPPLTANVHDFKKGMFYMIDSCDSVINGQQHDLNLECVRNNCTDIYVGLMIWGTIGKMRFDKDGLLFRSCGIIKFDGTNDTCVENFPFPDKTCNVQHISDHTVDADLTFVDQGYLIQSNYYAKTYQGLTKLVYDMAEQTGQTFTLPDGTETKKQK